MIEASDPLAETPFRVINLMSASKMARVFEVEHLALGTRYVAKVVDGAAAFDVETIDRMRLEAQTAARLGHANIPRLIAFDSLPSGAVYVVMERLVGVTLRQELSGRGALPELEAIFYVRQLLAALQTAHDNHVCHRDVRLENLFVHDLPKGSRTLKLMDFGLRQPNSRLLSDRSLDSDIRADVLGAALVLYELITGQCPLVDSDRHAQIGALPNELDLSAVVTLGLDRVLEKALSRNPKDRYETAEELDQALLQVIERESSDILIPRVLAASAALTFVVLGAATFLLRGF